MADYTKGPWRAGEIGHSVVADTPIPGTEHTGHSATEYYGGYLICESVWKEEDKNLIIGAPDMYKALKEVIAAANVGGQDFTDWFKDYGLGVIKKALGKAEGASI